MEKNLTSGSVLKTVIYFSLPYLLSYFLQTLYGMADLFIIGQFGGVDGTTAVSVGSQVMHMLTVMIVGLAMGATVLIGRAVGAGDRKLAARGTTLSQMCSVLIALVVIIKKRMFPGFRLRDLHLHKTTIASILQVGIPVAVQDGFIQVSFLVITMFANQRGLNDAAAVGIVEKLIGILFLVPSSLLSTVSALSAQNLGAGKPERARQTLRYAICITFSFGLIIAIAMQFAAGAAVSLFTDEAEVVRLGTQYMKSYVLDCMIAGIHFCCSGFFCACGLSGLSFLHNCISIVVARIPLAWLACRYFPETLYPMGLAAPIGSLISVAICLIALRWIRRHPEKLVMNLHPVETE